MIPSGRGISNNSFDVGDGDVPIAWLLNLRSRTTTTPAASSMLLCCTPASLCRCYAYGTPPRRARSLRGIPHHFAVATPTILRCAERVRSAAPRITLRLRLRYSAALSAFAPRHPASLCCWYAHETPPRRARSLHSIPASLCGYYAYDSPPRRVCCSAAWPDLVSSSTPSYPHESHSHSFLRPPATHKFEFQLFVSTIRLACG